MKKIVISHSSLYIAVLFPKNKKVSKFCLYVHGGPGSHSGYFEEFIKDNSHYNNSDIGWIIYDQRGCGRSSIPDLSELGHNDNIDDLKEVIEVVSREYKVSAIVGHSYGAFLLYDYNKKYSSSILSVFLGMARDMSMPRRRSLMIDINILKENQPEDYIKILPCINEYSDCLWKASKSVRKLIVDRSKRKLYYWGNIEKMSEYFDVMDRVSLEENNDTFFKVRSTLYSEEETDLKVYNKFLGKQFLWINGLHDYLMGGESESYSDNSITMFCNSGHYPHIEEGPRFLELLERLIG